MDEKKKKVGRIADYGNGYRRRIMQILLTSGVLSYEGLRMLEGENRMYVRKLKSMEEEGIVKTVKYKKKKAAKIVNFETRNQEYIQDFPGYYKHYNLYGAANATNVGRLSDPAKVVKAFRESEVTTMMVGCGIKTFPGEKANLKREETIGEEACYYSDIELKDANHFELLMTEEEKKEKTIINCRALGALISAGGNYIVYHAGREAIKWHKKSESQFAFHVSMLLNKYGTRKQEGRVSESILLASSPQPFLQMYREKRTNYIGINNGYSKMYLIPYTEEGQKLLIKMTEENWEEKEREEHLLPEGANIKTQAMTVACDGLIGDVYALLFCIPDVIKLQKFLAKAEWVNESDKFRIYCYDFQEEFIREVAGPYAEIYVTEIE